MSNRRRFLKTSAVLSGTVVLMHCGESKKVKMTNEFKQFVQNYENKIIPLTKDQRIAGFNASISGKDEDYKKSADLQIEVNKIFANKDDFNQLKKIKESQLIADSLLKRELDVIYNAYLRNQIDVEKLEELVNRQTEIEKKFNTFRAKVDGKELTDNEIDTVLKTSKNSQELEKTWKASKEIGKVVASDIIQLVKLRNEAAQELGFNNFHEMILKLYEQDPQEIEQLFDQLDSLTRESFILAKAHMDTILSEQNRIKPEQLMPWHYQNRFFQEAPVIYEVNLDVFYQNKDLIELTKQFYNGIGMPIDDILARSDLFEKPGKYQHARSDDIDRSGDVRVICNVKPTRYWMSTMLHEFGHAVYCKYIDRNLPWSLRGCAHAFTTEAVAMLFEYQASNPHWLKDIVGISAEESGKIAEDCANSMCLFKLVFSRWSQVMYRFEKKMYENPEQNLNTLWWDLVEQYQMIRRPIDRNDPDWASKIHIASAPAYYHNYLLGDLLASQFQHYITNQIIMTDLDASFAGKEEIGVYMINAVFKPGKEYFWNDMIQKATGEKLTPVYYAEQL
ncbi:M2 family metallopeptidase [Candidatus Latescibacterota bacterium]